MKKEIYLVKGNRHKRHHCFTTPLSGQLGPFALVSRGFELWREGQYQS